MPPAHRLESRHSWLVALSQLDLDRASSPLPVMGVAAAFGWSRRLKKKTKGQL